MVWGECHASGPRGVSCLWHSPLTRTPPVCSAPRNSGPIQWARGGVVLSPPLPRAPKQANRQGMCVRETKPSIGKVLRLGIHTLKFKRDIQQVMPSVSVMTFSERNIWGTRLNESFFNSVWRVWLWGGGCEWWVRGCVGSVWMGVKGECSVVGWTMGGRLFGCGRSEAKPEENPSKTNAKRQVWFASDWGGSVMRANKEREIEITPGCVERVGCVVMCCDTMRCTICKAWAAI